MVGTILNSLDALLNERGLVLSLDDVLPDQLVKGVLSELLVNDVQILVFPLQTLFKDLKNLGSWSCAFLLSISSG